MTEGGRGAILEGIRIVDLADAISGPVATMLLAEAGADVVKVEPPSGSPDRELPGFRTWNRSKRSVVADVDTDAGLAVVHQLLAHADVFVHDLVPERSAALGLDDATLATLYPRLIVSSVLGWPINHARANHPVDDLLTLAALGICDEQMPLNREGPIYIRATFASWAAAYLAAIAITARLLHRHQHGRGGPAHTSLVQGALVPMGMHWSRAEHPSEGLAVGMPKVTRGSQWTLFECSDGLWVHTMPPGPDRTPLMQELLAAMDPAIRDAANAAVPLSMNGYENLGANRLAMRERPSAQWLKELWEHDVPAQLAADYGDVLLDQQARANDYVIDLDDPEVGRITVAGFPFSINPPLRVRRPAPGLGDHTAKVLAEWSTPVDAAVTRPRTAAAIKPTATPLEGLRVLDAGNFLAGPYGAQVLADLGATVIKLEAATGDPMRFADWPFAGCQRGKRDIALNLKASAAAPVRDALIRWADVVHHNLRLPAARKLGLDSDNVRALNPNAIFCHVSSYGPLGERADWPGYDQLFQAQCGWETLGAGEGNSPMWHRFGFMDHLCALSSALATLLARYHQLLTGKAQDVRASLLGAGVLTNSETYVRDDGTLAPYARLNHDQTGVSEGRRIVETSDGWIAIAADQPAHLSALAEALDLTDLSQLEPAVRGRRRDDVIARLTAAGVPCDHVRLEQKEAFFDDFANQASGLVARYHHRTWGAFEQPGALWCLGDLEVRLPLAPPVLGEHTVEILRELGIATQQIDELLAAGIAVGF